MIRLFSSSCRPVSLGERCWAVIPEPIMVATRNAVPTSSAGLGGLVAWSTHRRCCSRCFGELNELAGQTLEHLGPQPVVGEPSRPLRLDDTGFSQHPQMVRDVGMASAGDLDEMAGAELLGRQSLDDRRPDRVAEYSDEVAIEVEVS